MLPYLLGAFITACSADAAVTAWSVQQHFAREVILSENRMLRDTEVAALTTVSVAALVRLNDRHPRAAKLIAIAATAARVAIVAHNIRVMRAGPPTMPDR